MMALLYFTLIIKTTMFFQQHNKLFDWTEIEDSV